MKLYGPDGRRVELSAERIGEGAEGMVLGVADSPDLCAKIYFDPTPERAERLDRLVSMPPASWDGDHDEHLHVAWPLTALVDADGATVGMLMPRVEGTSLAALFDPASRRCALRQPTWGTLVEVAGRIARLFAMLHAAGLMVGDVSPQNLLVMATGHVTLIDCDTVRVAGSDLLDASARKITPEYAAPQALREASRGLTVADDLFGLAILICQLLMEGDHPFEGVPVVATANDSILANIRLQNDRITHPERLRPTAGLYPVAMLPRHVLELALRCFGAGHHDPDARPDARAWAAAAYQGGYEAMGCRVNDQHVSAGSLATCLWCARVAAGLGDQYPPTTPATPRTAPVPPGPAQPQVPTRPPAPTRPRSPAPRRTAPPARPGAIPASRTTRARPGPRTAVVVALALIVAIALLVWLVHL
jgi:eukaryotic-like serine/threonine-protein kinase